MEKTRPECMLIMEFRHLISRFIEEEDLNLKTLEWGKRVDFPEEGEIFLPSSLQDKWKKFHSENAQLQLITAEKNLSKPRK